MKKRVVWLLMLAMAAMVSNAAVVLQLGMNDRNNSSVTWEFRKQGATVVLNGGNHGSGVELVENTLPGADGFFSVTLSAAQQIDYIDPWTWTFGPTTAKIYGWNKKGWGVCSTQDSKGLVTLFRGEAFLLKFDLSNLKLRPGNALVFSVLADESMEDQNYKIYRRTNRSSGQLVEAVAATHSEFSAPVVAGDSAEFAITDVGFDEGRTVLIRAFSFDVLPEAELHNAENVSFQGNHLETEPTPSLMPKEGLRINLSELSNPGEDVESPMTAAQGAIVVAVCIAILIPGIMVVVKVIS